MDDLGAKHAAGLNGRFQFQGALTGKCPHT